MPEKASITLPKKKQASSEYHREYRDKNRELRRKWNREWIARNRERYNASKFIYRDKVKIEGLSIYSGGDIKCKYCGETDIDVLCLDHIANNGAQHRKECGISGRGTVGANTYETLKKLNWPPGLQVLCANCNMKKQQQLLKNKRFQNRFYTNWLEKGVMPSVRDNDTLQLYTKGLSASLIQ